MNLLLALTGIGLGYWSVQTLNEWACFVALLLVVVACFRDLSDHLQERHESWERGE